MPDANLLVTADNFASAKQQRFLVGSLYSSLPQQTFLAVANVGIYYADGTPAIVPDVKVPENWGQKQNRAYLVWKFGKTPEVVIENVSNQQVRS
jgi:hypothetical protein